MNKSKGVIVFLAEVRESFFMGMGALAAHKLRSALTLLGVLVGVFSIIVVMTAMRVMQGNIENQLSQLGGQTFMVRKWPGVYFGGSGGWEKYWRRQNITVRQGQRLADKATLPASIGYEDTFWSGQIQARNRSSAPNVRLYGESAGSFSARNWILEEGRLLLDLDVDGARNVCVLGNRLARNLFPQSSPIGDRIKIDGINYTIVGVLEAKGGAAGGDQDTFAIIPITTAINRYGQWWRSISILVQARDAASYDETVEQVRELDAGHSQSLAGGG